MPDRRQQTEGWGPTHAQEIEYTMDEHGKLQEVGVRKTYVSVPWLTEQQVRAIVREELRWGRERVKRRELQQAASRSGRHSFGDMLRSFEFWRVRATRPKKDWPVTDHGKLE